MSEERQGQATVWNVQTVPELRSLKGNYSEIPNSSGQHNIKNLKNNRKSAAICSTGQFVQQLAAQILQIRNWGMGESTGGKN